MAGSTDGRVVIDTSLDNRGFIKGIRGMTGQVDGLRSAVRRLGAAITAVFAVKAVVDFGKKAVQLGSDVAEVQNVVDVAFGELSGQAEEFAQTAITQFGMSALSAKKTASTYMAMAKGMGVANQEAADMAVTLAGLSGDVASFFNISQELADIKLKSVFTGETETLKDLGVVMTQDNLKAYALSKGFQKSYDAMSQAEKVALRYRFVLDSLALASGDFARTQDSWANQTRILSMQWQEFMGILGQSIITVLKPVVKWLNAVLSHMIALATLLNNTVTRAFGGEAKQAEAASGAIASSVDNQEALAGAVEDTSKAQQKSLAGFDEINQLAGEAAGSAGGVGGGGAVDVGSLAIPDLSELEGTEGPSFASWGEAFSAFLDLMLAGVPKLKTAFGDFAAWLNECSGKVHEMFTFPGVLEKVEQLGRDLADALNHLVEQIDWYQLGQALGAGLNLALQFLVSFLYSFDWIAWGGSLAALVNGAVSEIDWYAFGMLLFRGIKIGLETLAGFLLGLDMPQLAQAASQTVIGYFNAMGDTVAGIDWAQIGAQIAAFLNNIDWAGAIAAFVEAARELILAFLEAAGGFLANADPEVLIAAAGLLAAVVVKRIVGTVVAPLAKELVDNVVQKIAEAMTSSGFASILSTVGKTIAGIGTIIGGVALAASSFFSMWNEGFSWAKEVLMLFGIALAAVGAVILGAPALVAGVIAGIVAAVATMAVVIHEHWEEIKQWFLDLWAGIQEVAGTIAEWFNSNVIQPVAGFFKGLWEGIQQAASSVWEAVKGVWSAAAGWFSQHVTQPLASAFDAAGGAVKGAVNGLLSNVEGMINAIIKGVNWLISQMNKISFDVPDWVPGIGGNSFGINIPSISEVKLPRLARGAVIPANREFMAVLGDQSHGNNLEAPEGLIRKIVREESGGGGETTALLQAILEAVKAGHIIMVDRRILGQTVTQEQNRMTRQSGRSVVLG
ncbi:MAG: hypothetical protein HFF40_00280 [Lawsonibacter sp.]|jgi:phage-related protein|nr:hypothetical protein [Lawsonibacter sp.]